MKKDTPSYLLCNDGHPSVYLHNGIPHLAFLTCLFIFILAFTSLPKPLLSPVQSTQQLYSGK